VTSWLPPPASTTPSRGVRPASLFLPASITAAECAGLASMRVIFTSTFSINFCPSLLLLSAGSPVLDLAPVVQLLPVPHAPLRAGLAHFLPFWSIVEGNLGPFHSPHQKRLSRPNET